MGPFDSLRCIFVHYDFGFGGGAWLLDEACGDGHGGFPFLSGRGLARRLGYPNMLRTDLGGNSLKFLIADPARSWGGTARQGYPLGGGGPPGRTRALSRA